MYNFGLTTHIYLLKFKKKRNSEAPEKNRNVTVIV